jgi:hypothetical protein
LNVAAATDMSYSIFDCSSGLLRGRSWNKA